MPIVTVLDLNAGAVHIYEYPNETENVEEFIEEQGHAITDCSYMCSDKLCLQIHDVGGEKKVVEEEDTIPERCELCAYINTSGTHATCSIDHDKIIPDISYRPLWCPLPLPF